MKKAFLLTWVVCGMLLSACTDSENENTDFTGRQVTYNLLQASDFPVYGTVTFMERADLGLQVEVKLEGTDGEAYHPVHFHYGDLGTQDADIAFTLNDLYADTGKSSTMLNDLIDNGKFGYDDLLKFDGSVKIHLSATGEGKDVVLAATNIGTAFSKQNSTGRLSIAVCKSN
ncbi:superoxide dismutase family protein [Fulvivirga ulvae]|uniref:superoxide dismutase family protein n=1 Tax=Fulvivirga ulvae TaxID=2904245 RepID=UPI001F27CD65|nr:superoxide dismutase family protein [Fulvivirga ulvae]UII32765.1 superoxide dismutase family protein [Fulvivirga ulvae]